MSLKIIYPELRKVLATYTHKYKIIVTGDWLMLKLQEELGELTQSYLMMTKRAREKDNSKAELEANFKKEIADLLAMTLLLADYYQVDVEKELEKKWFVWNKK